MSAPPSRSNTPTPAVAVIPEPAIEELTPYTFEFLQRKYGTLDWHTLVLLQDPDFSDTWHYLDLYYTNMDDPHFWNDYEFGDVERLRSPPPQELVDKYERGQARKGKKPEDAGENGQHVCEGRRDHKLRTEAPIGQAVTGTCGVQRSTGRVRSGWHGWTGRLRRGKKHGWKGRLRSKGTKRYC
ncbi:hypothetical protein V8F33_013535 [Rhypophila sp. PSN 637]